jgi:phosphatidylserine/phosphatidylglycerophosphate/cardiolipin synthase-like enzyme
VSAFTNAGQVAGLTAKLWRGERMCLIGMDVAHPEPDLVGFSIEVKSPGNTSFLPLRNRLNFSYDQPVAVAVNGYRNYLSTQAPFQKFRWIHFPYEPKAGTSIYRVAKRHMPTDGHLVAGASLTLDIPLGPAVYDDVLNVGFTRNFASSQAYADRYGNNPNVIPAKADAGLGFTKVTGDVYRWLGFEVYDLLFGFLDQVVADPSLTLDVMAYDLKEPDVVRRLEQIGKRLRIIIDDSASHAPATSAESRAAKRLGASAGASRVKRTHFKSLQHHKVLIARRNGQPVKVLFGSTNFSFRGLYIQANNGLVFHGPEAAALFEDPLHFARDPIARQWHLVQPSGGPPVHFCFSPHTDPDLSLNPVAAAIDQATSSVFFAIAFLYQSSGVIREAVDRPMKKQVFSNGISDKRSTLEVKKPDGSIGLVDFAYLASKAPEPFKTEWSGGAGINQHDKLVVTDFNLPTAKVFTGSSNLSPNVERGNGDNLVMIEDQRVAIAYAIEELRVFDHLHFRSRMEDVPVKKKKVDPLTLGRSRPRSAANPPGSSRPTSPAAPPRPIASSSRAEWQPAHPRGRLGAGGAHHVDIDFTVRRGQPSAGLAARTRTALSRDRRHGWAHLGGGADAPADDDRPSFRAVADHSAHLRPRRRALPGGGLAGRSARASGVVRESLRAARDLGAGDGRPVQGPRPYRLESGEAGSLEDDGHDLAAVRGLPAADVARDPGRDHRTGVRWRR